MHINTNRSLNTKYIKGSLQKLCRKLVFVLGVGLILTASAAQQAPQPQTSDADLHVVTTAKAETALEILNALHHFAATAAWNEYFALYLPTAVFIGTDASENWNMSEFEQYARPTKGWRYTVKSRKWQQYDNVIVFEELLDNQSYGESRGTGTLLRTLQGWKIAQYHLSFPIPNKIAKELTRQIMEHEK